MRVGWAIGRRIAGNPVRPVHFAAVVHRDEGGVGVVEAVILGIGPGGPQINRLERNALAQ